MRAALPWLTLALTGCFSAPAYQGPRRPNFDGARFVNQVPTEHAGFRKILAWQAQRRQGQWQRVEAAPGPAPPRRVGPGELRLTVVNHATVLVQVDGVNLLTDPIYSERCSPVSWAGPARWRPPGLRFEDLPLIDGVLISHNHYDHLDLDTLRRLVARDGPPVFAGLGTRALLEREGLPGGVDLDWWAAGSVKGLKVRFVPARHFSGRGTDDRDTVLWGGFVIEALSGPVYFAGDTGFGPHFGQIRARYPRLRAALLPIGAFRPRAMMRTVHMDPYDAVRAHAVLGAPFTLGIHFETFGLADDGQSEPRRVLAAAKAKRGASALSFAAPVFGRGYPVPPLSAAGAPPAAPGPTARR